ncbi:hypothetical protein [Streptomyces sp. NBC_00083]|uniref:hypothetical protein n=1 Tax=Streptomyces sp. NBC_00083 TaxID=2975647 RepID=UPI00225A153E|nr:hypothetical protein [Streptomyces sp. NBC_00083]MCX5385037.1 hypothetical protein [Streptomyces sp. NBC_00083]
MGGVVRTGQKFVSEAAPDGGVTECEVMLTAIDRYGRDVDFFDPPHAAKVHLSGRGVSMLQPGLILVECG